MKIKFKQVAALICTTLVVLTCTLPSPVLAADSSTDSDVSFELSAEEQKERFSSSTLSVEAGTIAEQQLLKDYPDADLQIFQSETDETAALISGKIDYSFVTEFFARSFIANNPGYQYVTPAYMTFDNCFGVAEGNDELRTKLNESLARLREDGTLDAVKKKWEIDRNYTMDDVPVREDGEVLTVATMGTSEPYTFVMNGKDAGSAVEIMMRVAYDLGYRVEFLDMSFTAELAAISSGKADIGLQVTPTDERDKQIDFSDPYLSSAFVALTKSGDTAEAGFLRTLKSNFTSTFITENRWQLVLSGLGVTALIVAGSFVLGTLAGGLLAAMRRSRRPILRGIAKAYGKITTGIPALVWLMILYYIVFAGIDISSILVSVICFGLLSASALAEIYLTGLNSVDKGQMEAATAMGFSHAEAYRRIILPQAAKNVWPLYSGQLTTLIKETSIVGYVAIQDLTKVSDIIRSRTFQAFFPLFATAAVYFALIALCAWVFGRLGRRLDPRRRKPGDVLKGIEVRRAS